MTFVFQRQALEEYQDAAAYIAESSAQNAGVFIQRVEATIAQILRHPDANIRGRHGTLRRKVVRSSLGAARER
jgi:plasmid stabilization system protein ParE